LTGLELANRFPVGYVRGVMLHIVGMGPGGHRDHLTLRAWDVLTAADVVIYPGANIADEISSAITGRKLVGERMNDEEVRGHVTAALGKEDDVVLLLSGDPSLFSGEPGHFESLSGIVSWCVGEGIKFEVIPGISSVSALAALLGIEHVALNRNQTVIMHAPSRQATNSEHNTIEKLAEHKCSLVFFLCIDHIQEIAQKCLLHHSPQTPYIIAEMVGHESSRIHRGELSELEAYAATTVLSSNMLLLIGECYSPQETTADRS
jgi:precorrin-4/cobalt-precorrin-4 C11-methyltransferase